MGPWYVGAHIPRKKTLEVTLDEIRRVGGNALQIFVSSPRSGRITPANFAKYESMGPSVQSYLKTHDCKLFIHSAYTLNFAKPLPADPSKAYWVASVLQELRIAHALGADGVVLHTGRHVDLTPAQGLANMRKALMYVLNVATKEGLNSKLLLETPSGMGTELLSTIQDFLRFYIDLRRHYPQHIRICFDTAHVWAAGYDPATLIAKMPKKDVALIQLNNSRVPIDGHIDRHADIHAHNGRISWKTLKEVVQKTGAPLILETPGVNAYKTEIPWLVRAKKEVVSHK